MELGMKHILFISTSLIALTGFGGVVLSKAHSHVLNEVRLEKAPVQEPVFGLSKLDVSQPNSVQEGGSPRNQFVSSHPQTQDEIVNVGEVSLLVSMRPKARPAMWSRSVATTVAYEIAELGVASSQKSLPVPLQASSPAQKLSGRSASRGLFSPFRRLQPKNRVRNQENDRSVYEMGTQVGVYR